MKLLQTIKVIKEEKLRIKVIKEEKLRIRVEKRNNKGNPAPWDWRDGCRDAKPDIGKGMLSLLSVLRPQTDSDSQLARGPLLINQRNQGKAGSGAIID